MPTLDEIGLKWKTDKSSMTHCYLNTYEKYLSEWKDKEFVLLELGVAGGSSIGMWREFFPKAKVYGIDNNPDCAGEGIFIGSVTDKVFMDKVLSEIGSPNIVIEDSAHIGEVTIKVFKYLFPKIASGGILAIEDSSTFFSSTYSGEFESNGRSKVYNFFTDLPYHVELAGRAMTGNYKVALETQNTTFDKLPEYSEILESIHIHQGLWILKRR